MLKSIVNGAEHDIISIPMKGKNLFDINKIRSNGSVNRVDNTLIATTPSSSAGVVAATPNKLKDYCPDLKVGDTVTISFDTTGTGRYIYLLGSNVNWYLGRSRTVSQSDLDSTVVWYASGTSTVATISNIMFNLGTTALPYEQYGYQKGWEVRDNQNRLIWGREDELQTTTGTLLFKGYDLPIKVKSLLGNSTQNGTPSPSPVNPNLVDPSKTVPGYQQSNGTIHEQSSGNERTTDWIPFTTDKLYAIVSGSNGGNINWVLYDSNKQPLYFYGPTFSPNTVSEQ